MLDTVVSEIESPDDFRKTIEDNEMLVICAGRRGPMCILVYGAMEQIEKEGRFESVKMITVDFDTESALPIRMNKKCRHFMGLPFTAYYKDGEMVHATSSIQYKGHLEDNMKQYLLDS